MRDTASGDASLMVSETERAPRTSPSQPAQKAVSPRPSITSRACAKRSGINRPASAINLGLPAVTSTSPTVPRTPRPGSAWNDSTGSSSMPRSSAPSATALPTGCSLAASTDATSRRKSGSSLSTSLSVMTPRVSVPVLSKRTVSIDRERSNTSASLNSTPSSAPRPDPTMIAVGVARPRAHGQAMINTAVALRMASTTSAPEASQATSVTAATAITNGTNTPATRSASFCTGARDACASSTSRTTWARAVSAPTASATTTTRPCWLMVAPYTLSPAALSTGIDSPVSMDSSKADAPSTMAPSVGTLAPGRMTMRSPGTTSSTGTRCSRPSRRTTASVAPSSSSEVMASVALRLALASKKRPRRMNVTMTAAVSKNTGSPANTAHTEYP